jgi:hypothetical protein
VLKEVINRERFHRTDGSLERLSDTLSFRGSAGEFHVGGDEVAELTLVPEPRRMSRKPLIFFLGVEQLSNGGGQRAVIVRRDLLARTRRPCGP